MIEELFVRSVEVWKDITGYEGLYQASTHGRIKSYCKYDRGRILKSFRYSKYLGVALFENKKHIKYYVHRLVALTFIPNPENKPCINHKDGDKDDNRIENLEWCTQQENLIHKINILGEGRGDKHGNSVISEKRVGGIKFLLKEGKLTQRQIAKRYKIDYRIVNQINKGITWVHIGDYEYPILSDLNNKNIKSRYKVNDVVRNKIAEYLMENGMSKVQIAKKFKVSRNTVYRISKTL